ncbi:transposase, partial [Burkholderia ubonensis]|uniref:DesA/ISL3 alpha bundle tail domain-containing protein n=1 Tax=Burkholderia ubonensis TaxID=101571 RepID=UPI0018DFD59A
MSAESQIKLHELLKANHALISVYVLKSVLKELWQSMTAWQWHRAWRNWLAQARVSGIEPLQRFANKLAAYWRGILSRVRWNLSAFLWARRLNNALSARLHKSLAE